MENSIEWSIKIGSEEFIKHWKNLRTIFSVFISLVCVYILGSILITILEDKLLIPKSIAVSVTASGIVLLFVLIALSTYRANRELLKEEVRNYKVDSSGVTINGNFYVWSNYKYFLDNSKVFGDAAGKLSSPIIETPYSASVNVISPLYSASTKIQPTERWIISLNQSKYSDKDKILLVMDNIDTYNKVMNVVKGKLEEIIL
jgi:hypothetical protein